MTTRNELIEKAIGHANEAERLLNRDSEWTPNVQAEATLSLAYSALATLAHVAGDVTG
jgi:hypothetical protein